jgi:hypothetical protein
VFDTAPPLLLEGAWLLVVADGIATHDEILIVAAIAARTPPDAVPWISRLERADEAGWIAAARRLEPRDRALLMNGLLVTAGLRGPTRHPERSFLDRAGAALGLRVDFDRVDAILRALDGGADLDRRALEGLAMRPEGRSRCRASKLVMARGTALHTRPGTCLAPPMGS